MMFLLGEGLGGGQGRPDKKSLCVYNVIGLPFLTLRPPYEFKENIEHRINQPDILHGQACQKRKFLGVFLPDMF